MPSDNTLLRADYTVSGLLKPNSVLSLRMVSSSELWHECLSVAAHWHCSLARVLCSILTQPCHQRKGYGRATLDRILKTVPPSPEGDSGSP